MKVIQLFLNRLPALFGSKRRGVDSKCAKGVTTFEHSWNIDVIEAGTVQLCNFVMRWTELKSQRLFGGFQLGSWASLKW